MGPSADPGAPWLHKVTDWVPSFLHYMQDTWKPAGGVAVTEFGFAEPFEARKVLLQDILTDPVRSSYFRDYMRAILAAMSEGVNVVGCLAWSFVDNYEVRQPPLHVCLRLADDFKWQQGFSTTFGMQYVNFTDPARPRYFKASFFEYVRAFELYQEK
jgi:beta-glucosidase